MLLNILEQVISVYLVSLKVFLPVSCKAECPDVKRGGWMGRFMEITARKLVPRSIGLLEMTPRLMLLLLRQFPEPR